MAFGYSIQAQAKYSPTPDQLGEGAQVNGERRSQTITITGASLVSQGVGAVGDTILVSKLPAGSQYIDAQLQSDTVLTGATLNVGYGPDAVNGPTTSSNAYGSFATPAANTLYTARPVARRTEGQITADRFLYLTIAGAALPTSFNMELLINYQIAN